MTERPKAGGRYVRDDKGNLTLVQRTLPPEPDQVPTGAVPPAPKPADKKKEA